MTGFRSITRIVAATFIALALGSCAMNAQQQPGQPQSQQPSPGPAVSGPAGSTSEGDPNLPGMTSPTGGVTTPSGVRVQWIKTDPSHPQVTISGPGVPYGSTQYYGWNDQGSYLRNNNDRQVYIWNFSKGSLTKLGPEIPSETFAGLRNNPNAVAKNTAPPPAPKAPEPQTPDTSRQAAFFGGGGNVLASSGGIAGTGAAIQGGVLTFTRADKTKASYKVVRPKVAQGAPGNTGTWIAMEDGGKGILFTVQSDGTLTGHEMPAQFIQMLAQSPAR